MTVGRVIVPLDFVPADNNYQVAMWQRMKWGFTVV